jgi:hypothetical protein
LADTELNDARKQQHKQPFVPFRQSCNHSATSVQQELQNFHFLKLARAKALPKRQENALRIILVPAGAGGHYGLGKDINNSIHKKIKIKNSIP